MNLEETAKSVMVAVVGGGTSSVGWFIEVSEPILRLILLAGQAAAAVLTALYFFQRWRNARRDRKP